MRNLVSDVLAERLMATTGRCGPPRSARWRACGTSRREALTVMTTHGHPQSKTPHWPVKPRSGAARPTVASRVVGVPTSGGSEKDGPYIAAAGVTWDRTRGRPPLGDAVRMLARYARTHAQLHLLLERWFRQRSGIGAVTGSRAGWRPRLGRNCGWRSATRRCSAHAGHDRACAVRWLDRKKV